MTVNNEDINGTEAEVAGGGRGEGEVSVGYFRNLRSNHTVDSLKRMNAHASRYNFNGDRRETNKLNVNISSLGLMGQLLKTI